MLAGPRFRLYRRLLGMIMAGEFKRQKVWPLEPPSNEIVEVTAVAAELPRLFRACTFPSTEHAKPRERAIKLRGRLLPLATRIPARRTGPIATDLPGLLEQIYPEPYRRIWSRAPTVPPELEDDDIPAALAVRGPFAQYLRKASTLGATQGAGGGGDDPGPDGPDPDDYVIDMRCFDGHRPKPGLVAPGGLAVFDVVGERLRTRAILFEGRAHRPGDPSYGRACKAFLCALNTYLTTFTHNVTIHLAYLTPTAVASANALAPHHPIRRLLHPAFHTVLIGNHEVATFQIVGAGSFATKLFSHEYPTLVRMLSAHLDDFRIADLDPQQAFDQHGLRDAPVALPFWDDDLALWRITLRYAEAYIDRYYGDDEAVAADPELRSWLVQLDHLLPHGLYDGHGYLTKGDPLTRATLARVCATLLHTSSATHDVVNNAVWDYSTINFVLPTVVPESPEEQDMRLSFDLMNTIIGTWKRYNMLLDGVSTLALDEEARTIMDGYVDALRRRQAEMVAEPRRLGRIYPANLNPSISN